MDFTKNQRAFIVQIKKLIKTDIDYLSKKTEVPETSRNLSHRTFIRIEQKLLIQSDANSTAPISNDAHVQRCSRFDVELRVDDSASRPTRLQTFPNRIFYVVHCGQSPGILIW